MERDEYLKMAAVEDGMWYYHALHAHVRRALARTQERRYSEILDAGCGTGGLIRRLEPWCRAWQWTGLDLSEVACGLARGRCGATITAGSVTALPFRDASFDVVVSADVLYHVHEDVLALREAWRVLRPGGCIVINVPAYRWLWSYHDEATHAVRRYARAELRKKIEGAGFTVQRLTHWNALPLPLVVLKRKVLPADGETSDVKAYPLPVEWGFRGAMALESSWLGLGLDLPFGSSLFAVAVKSA